MAPKFANTLLGANKPKPDPALAAPAPKAPSPAVPAYNNAALPISDFAILLIPLTAFLPRSLIESPIPPKKISVLDERS